MLPRKNRLTTGYEFRMVRKLAIPQRKFFKTELFDLYYYDFPLNAFSAETEPPKAGVLISKKFHKKAVVRNRTRRRLMACLAPHISALKDNIKIVIYPKEGILLATYENLDIEIAKVLQKISVAGKPGN